MVYFLGFAYLNIQVQNLKYRVFCTDKLFVGWDNFKNI